MQGLVASPATARGRASICALTMSEIPAEHARVTVRRVGMCGTDVGIVRKGRPVIPGDVVLGHEIFGVLDDGTRVVVDPFITCASCDACARGESNLCNSLEIVGVHRDGGFAPYVDVPAHQILPVPDSVSDVQASVVEPLATALHAWRRVTVPMERIGIIGAGAIGLSMVAIAKAHGVSVDISDIDEAMLAHARDYGVSAAGHSLTHNDYDAVFECVGLAATRSCAVEATRAGGATVLVGLADPRIDVEGRAVVTFQRALLGSFGYTHEDMVDALALAGTVDPRWVSDHTLEELLDVLTGARPLAEGKVKAQFVAPGADPKATKGN